MSYVRSFFGLGCVVAGLLSASCSEPTEESGREPDFARVVPTCLPGCTETDPYPTQPGIFLTSAVTDITCFDGGGTDRDVDGLPDRCENDIARAFAPQLAISGSDRTGREPHWAAKSILTRTPNVVRIAYALSYYVDDGPTTSWCNNNIVDLVDREACHGHVGDSELIVLDVYYDRTLQHWLLDCAIYSQHEDFQNYCRLSTKKYPIQLVYPGKLGGYPRSYVAYQKHANYNTEAACDDGAIAGTDTCFPSRYEMVYAGGNVNIGSRFYHTLGQDCMFSSNPLYADNGRKECYWTSQRFKGWQLGSPDAEAYSPRLQLYGF